MMDNRETLKRLVSIQENYAEESGAYQVLEIAKEAVGRQIPEKPIKDNPSQMRYVNTYTCPACEGAFAGREIARNCYHCGQRLDWDN